MILRPNGHYASVCALPDNRFAFVWTSQDYQTITCEIDGTVQWTAQRPVDVQGWGIDVDCAADGDGHVWAICKAYGAADRAYLIEPGATPRDVGPSYGGRAQKLAWNGSQMVRFVLLSGYAYARNGLSFDVPMPQGTSQGWLQVTAGATAAEDRLVWAKIAGTEFVDVPGARLADPMRAGSYIVGASLRAVSGGMIRIDGWDGAKLFTALDSRALGDCYQPAVALAGGRLAVAAMTERGAALVEGPPFAPYGTAPIPDPPDPPDPSEPPMPTVPPEQINIAIAMLAIVRADTDFGPEQPPLPYVRETARRLGYPWGLNGKRGNPQDISTDILAYDFPNRQPQLFDVLLDGGGANGAVFNALEYPQPFGAVFVPVDGTPDPPDPPEPPQPPDLDAAIRRVLDGMKISLRTDDGHYVCAEGGGGGEVNATRTAAGGWETFTVKVQP